MEKGKNAIYKTMFEKYPELVCYEKMLAEHPSINLFNGEIKEGIEKLYLEKGCLSDSALENLSLVAEILHDWDSGGLTPREYKLFLPHVFQLVNDERISYCNYRKFVDNKNRKKLTDKESNKQTNLYNENSLLRMVLQGLDRTSLTPSLVKLESDEKGNFSFELKEDFLPSVIPYQTLRSEERIMKSGTYNYTDEDAKNLSNVARFLFGQTIKQKGIVLDMCVDIEYSLFTPSLTFQTGPFIYSNYKNVLEKIEGYSERLAKDNRKKCNYFPKLTRLSSLFSQFGNTFVWAVHNDTYPRSELEVKISSTNEASIDNLFKEVKRISHKN